MADQDPSEIDPEMAAFLGFSSFGTQPAAKKRKYNHRADAATSADAAAASATGANQIALAPRAPAPVPVPAPAPSGPNADEIALDSEDDAPVAGGDGAADADKDAEEGGAALYADPSVAPALAHAQSLIDELATRGAASDASPNGAAQSLPATLPRRPEASWGAGMGSLPTMPAREHDAAAGHQPRGRRHQNQCQREDGKPWWEGYYDPTSNDNPWEKLERAAGVPARGSWVPRAEQVRAA
ncbi:hypothetical protein CCHL11_03754 [Colletotrichum chlorophyti]|uniref:Uncharacterized protein n=1 Tax=Colletotrichum chlorophyti TaxID=708187 RepID=A0A1Q8RQQ7_9PEZI|nr:hypothetical protein CCHL11_03754 [Colletotrichum chlorophyti]